MATVNGEFTALLRDLRLFLKSSAKFMVNEAPATIKDILEDGARRSAVNLVMAAVFAVLGSALTITLVWYMAFRQVQNADDLYPCGATLVGVIGLCVVVPAIFGCVSETLDYFEITKNPRSWLLGYVRNMAISDD
jgi:hypothetical protein